jgi:hypothetical protein
MLRIDQGTANLATPLQALLKQVTTALTQQGLLVTSVAVSEMYAQEPIWALRDQPKAPIADKLAVALREASASRAGTLPTSCPTDALLNEGAALWAWTYAGSVRPFTPGPGALMVILVDSGARPHPFDDCHADDFSNADPTRWVRLDRTLRIRQTLFLLLATPENGDLTALRQRCAATPGFPLAGLDVLAPSSMGFFDPWAAQMNARKPGLANRIDLCDALGAAAPGLWNDIAKRWYQILETLR